MQRATVRHENITYVGITYTVMRCLTTAIRSEQCVVRRFRRCASVIECNYTKLV